MFDGCFFSDAQYKTFIRINFTFLLPENWLDANESEIERERAGGRWGTLFLTRGDRREFKATRKTPFIIIVNLKSLEFCSVFLCAQSECKQEVQQ